MNVQKLITDHMKEDTTTLNVLIKLDCGHVNQYNQLIMIMILITPKNDLRCFICSPN